ncbi:hypothetical protein BGP78_03730 [Pseudoalteromonas sp. MSK9-3]|uniref:alpha/beta hydrolase n=1 Tax=Pseudoalteromonas sp. MSK9-3 TaxID=1897633 RepID=UPI000E6CB525|nr:alpha/beta hydrolase [Pseudoalteromonas sp. MSK9-3]RJE73380.1 hypothetical protein BGP78_03730 [Pseudoalteromonas sp. MSK9-3]
MIRLITSAVLALFISGHSIAGQVYADLPTNIDRNAKYVFYSHGYIVEGDNPKPVDTRFGWGMYDFPAIKQALADSHYHLIAQHRAKDTDPFEYAYTLNTQVRTLVEQGVKPTNITIMGFSRGAFITGLTSDKLSDLGVNTIILAGCGRLVWKKHTDVKVYGHVLSVYEKTDKSGSCEKLAKKSTETQSFREIAIHTGLSHGAFYRPLAAWVDPVKAWINAAKE